MKQVTNQQADCMYYMYYLLYTKNFRHIVYYNHEGVLEDHSMHISTNSEVYASLAF
jgi:hypothetical protein